MSAATKETHDLTIDELARRSGMTVRNIRAHQSRGLLPAPIVRGRTGFYGDEHLLRLIEIKDLQAEGFNLTAIQRLLEQSELTGQGLGTLRSSFLTPFPGEETEIVDFKVLAKEVGLELDQHADLISRAEKAGFIMPIGGDQYEVLSPTILRAGMEVIKLGVSVEDAFKLLLVIRKNMRSVADAFTRLADDHVIRPFQDRGFDPEEWPAVQETIERISPLASQVAIAAFRVEMTEAAEEAFGKALARAARKPAKVPESQKKGGDEKPKRDRSSDKSKRPPSPSSTRRRPRGAKKPSKE